MPTLFERPRSSEVITPALVMMFMAFVSTMAFSYETKRKIKKRDGYMSRESGATENLEAAHYDHNKKNPLYDHPSSGRLLTRREHYLDHYTRHGQSSLGLNRYQNRWALNSIWDRMTDEERKGLPTPPALESDDGMQVIFEFEEKK